VSTDLSGDIIAESKTDMRTGLMMAGKNVTTIKGDIEVMGRTVPVKIKIKKDMQAKKIN
jgi:hypothetical protein